MISADFLETIRRQQFTCRKRIAGNHRADDRRIALCSQPMGIGDRFLAQFLFQPQAGVAERLHRDHPRIVLTQPGEDGLRIDDVQLKNLGRASESMTAAKPLHRRVLAAHERANLPRSLVRGISHARRHQSAPDAATLRLRSDGQQIQLKAASARRIKREQAADESDDISMECRDKGLALGQNTAHSRRIRFNGGDARDRGDAPDRAGVSRLGEADLYAH